MSSLAPRLHLGTHAPLCVAKTCTTRPRTVTTARFGPRLCPRTSCPPIAATLSPSDHAPSSLQHVRAEQRVSLLLKGSQYHCYDCQPAWHSFLGLPRRPPLASLETKALLPALLPTMSQSQDRLALLSKGSGSLLARLAWGWEGHPRLLPRQTFRSVSCAARISLTQSRRRGALDRSDSSS